MNDKIRRNSVAAAIAITLAASAINTAAAATNDTTVTPAGAATETAVHYSFPGWNDPVMGNLAVYSGQALLHKLQSAQQALQDKRIDDARGAIDASQNLASSIKQMMPYMVVVDQLDNAKNKLLGEDDTLAVDDFLPIYSSLDELEAYAPQLAQHARAKVKEAEKHVTAGDHQRAAQQLKEVASDISATVVYMPVVYVSDQVRVAEKALDRKNPDVKTARQAIDSALNSLVVHSDNLLLTPARAATAKQHG
jgi:hypothetical protein